MCVFARVFFVSRGEEREVRDAACGSDKRDSNDNNNDNNGEKGISRNGCRGRVYGRWVPTDNRKRTQEEGEKAFKGPVTDKRERERERERE